MSISKRIINYLEKQKYSYQLVEHKTVYTAFDKAQTQHIDPRAIAKALVVKADNKFAIALIPANRKLSIAKAKKAVNQYYKNLADAEAKKSGKKVKFKAIKNISLANEAWMKKNIPGKIGAVPPLRGLLGLDIFADKNLLKNKKIQVGSGDYEHSLILSTSQFKKKEDVLGVDLSEKKRRA